MSEEKFTYFVAYTRPSGAFDHHYNSVFRDLEREMKKLEDIRQLEGILGDEDEPATVISFQRLPNE